MAVLDDLRFGAGPVDREQGSMGRISGWMWLLSAVAAGIALFLPGAGRAHLALGLALSCVLALYGLASVRDWIPWSRASLRAHCAATATGLGVIGFALWVTGGSHTYLLPVVVCVLLYVAWFFPARMAWALVAGLVLVGASPMLYDAHALDDAWPSLTLLMAVAFTAVTAVIQSLKLRLVEAEARQRAMAVEDALTGVGNRRAFDLELDREIAGFGAPARGRRRGDATEAGFAVLFFDVDDFKAVNDRWGHPAGDRVLVEVARRTRAVARSTDAVARIGGDEFAVIARGCGAEGAERLSAAVAEAVGTISPDPQAEPVTATVAWAVFPDDGVDAATLMRGADRRLHARKHALGVL